MGCELGNLCWFYWFEIGWLKFVKNGRFTRFKSGRGRTVVYAMPTAVWILQKQWAWDPLTYPIAGSLASWLCALWGRHEGAGGGRLLPGCGASGVGRSPTPNRSSFGACGRGPLPTSCGCCVQAWGPGCPWHRLPCRGSSCVARATRVCGTQWPLWLGTCPGAVVVAGGVPLWRAPWPRIGVPHLVRSGRSRCSCQLAHRRGAFPQTGGCRPRPYWVAARSTWRPAENRAHFACRWPLRRQGRWARAASYPFRPPRWGCPRRVPPPSVLGCLRCRGLVCVHAVTDASGYPYRPLFDGGLGRCSGAVSCGRRHLSFQVGGRHARVPRVCVCVLFLAGLGGPASWARFGAPHLFLWPVLVRSWFVVVGFFLFFFFFPCCAPVVSCVPCFPARGALGLAVLLSSRPPPRFFAFGFFSLCAPAVSGVPCFAARGAFGLGVMWSSAPPPPSLFFFPFAIVPLLFFFPLLRPLVFCVPWFPAWGAVGLGALWSSRVALLFVCFFPLPPWFFFSALLCRLCGSPARLCVLAVGDCWCVLLWALCPGGGRFVLVLCRWVLPGCARSVCVVACCVAALRCVLCFAWCCVGCLCWAWFLLRAAAPCCRLVVPCRGPWLCSVLGCGAAFLWCAASHVLCCCVCRVLLVVRCCFVRADWCCVVSPVVAGISLLGLVACCCFPLACVVAGAPAWSRGWLPCCVLWLVVVPRSRVLCPAFCGAVLLCGAVPWRPAVRFSLLVVLVCVFSLCVRCCVALRVVLFGAGLVRAVVGASCCGVSLCAVVSPWALCGVVVLLWCVVVSCCPVRCPVVSCAVRCVVRCCAALWCCAGWLCCAVVCPAGACFSCCPLFPC